MTRPRLDVEFRSHGKRCKAWLYLPDGARPAPVIVMAHGLGSVRTMRLDVYAERFRAEGYACLVFDYRNFGDSEGEPRQLIDIEGQLEDWASAIGFARSRKDVDGGRVILWGTSFSGGHVIAAAVADGNIAAVVSQCPFTDGPASSMAVPFWTSSRITVAALRDLASSWIGGRPVEVALAGKPGSVALMSAPDCEDGYLGLVPPSQRKRFKNRTPARIAVKMLTYSPGKKARELTCPALFCVCEADTVAPAAPTLRHVRRAPHGEVKIYKEGHFDIYVGEAFERTIADQITYLHRTVAV